MEYLGMSYEERSQLRWAARQSKDYGLGFCMKPDLYRADGSFEPGLWTPNSISNEGYDTIWNVYFKGGTQPTGATAFYVGLVEAVTSGWSLASVIGDMDVPEGTGYAAQPINASTNWTIAGNPMVATAAQVTFTAGGTWDPVIGAYLYASVANKLICYDAFAASRTLYLNDTLKVTLTLTREAATE